jgi:hypothetical protein
VVAVVVGFCCSEVLLEMPLIFTNDDYAALHFLHGFCDGIGGLLQWNTGDDKQIHFETHFRICVEF